MIVCYDLIDDRLTWIDPKYVEGFWDTGDGTVEVELVRKPFKILIREDSLEHRAIKEYFRKELLQ